MQRLARLAELGSAGDEVDGVVAVAPVRRAPPRRHKSAIAEQTQVVGHQVLGLAEQQRQLLDRPIAAHQLA